MSGEGLVGNENTIVSRQKSILHDMVLFNMLKSHLKTIFLGDLTKHCCCLWAHFSNCGCQVGVICERVRRGDLNVSHLQSHCFFSF